MLKTIDGQAIDLGGLYGKQAVYLKFWATRCVPCRELMPHFERTYEAAGTDLAVIAINPGFNDSVEEIRKYRRKLGITMPIVFDDGRAAAAFHLRVTPQHIVIGRDGRIQYVGHLADARLDSALMAARMPADARAIDPGPAAAATGTGSPAGMRRYAVGDRLPRQSLLTVEGHKFPLRNPGDSHHTVLVFLSPWCESYLAATRPPMSADCRRIREQVSTIARDHDARWLGVASGLWATADDLRDYQAKYHVNIPLTLDESGALFRAFHVTQVPAVVVADEAGIIRRRLEAADAGDEASLRGRHRGERRSRAMIGRRAAY